WKRRDIFYKCSTGTQITNILCEVLLYFNKLNKMANQEHSRKKVSYFYNADIAHSHFGANHPMKPHRLAVTNNLIVEYGLYKRMSVYKPFNAHPAHMKSFHKNEYIDLLQKVTPDNITEDMTALLNQFNIGRCKDCPIFDNMFEFVKMSTGGSIAAATSLNRRSSDIAINWAGGMHHAKKSEASGFCYVNDIVIAILELLRQHTRVLYVDIDVHHGDGVEEAFYTTNRVMTVSFHLYGKRFFPGTGSVKDYGAKDGEFYSLNVPLKSGIDDETYERIFVPVMTKVMEVYRPSAVVLQCGADSLAGDRLGRFNLTLKGHGRCVEFMRSFNIPLMLLGGGGYTVKNVSRCWTYETSIALNVDIPDDMPHNEYFEHFKPNYKLHIKRDRNEKNMNTKKDIERLYMIAVENLRHIEHAPSIGIFRDNSDVIDWDEFHNAFHDFAPPDIRCPDLVRDRIVSPSNEFFDDDF
ncbi:CLUMA_CG011595, isoform A, partial [Clunio marinus]